MFDSLGGFELRELRNRNIKFNKENRPNLYYPFYINPATEDEHGLHEISLEPKDGWIELYIFYGTRRKYLQRLTIDKANYIPLRIKRRGIRFAETIEKITDS